MLRYLLVILFNLGIFSEINSQTNLLAIAGIKNTQPTNFSELGNFYYCFKVISGHVINPNNPNVVANVYEVVKIDKTTNKVVNKAIVCGDTLQVDSIVFNWQVFLVMKDEKLHFLYNKVYYTITPPIQGATGTKYLQMDTGLHIIVPEKTVNCSFVIQNFVVFNRDSLLFSWWQQTSTFEFSKYGILSANGDLIRTDTFEVKPIPFNASHQVVDVLPYANRTYLVTGGILPNNNRGFYLADSNLTLIDTFYLKPTIIPYNGGSGYIRNFPQIISLPTGSMISAGIYDYTNSVKNALYTILGKHSAHSRFNTDNIQVFESVDTNDYIHVIAPARHTLEYNPHDNSVYFSNTTNKSAGLNSCNTNYSFIQVIRTDTNLNTNWRKFIYFGLDSCVIVSRVSTPDSRNGIVLTGYVARASNPNDPLFNYSFAFYIDSSGIILSNPNELNLKMRNRISIYPNPVYNDLHIDDLLANISKVIIFNLNAKAVYQKSMKETRISPLISILCRKECISLVCQLQMAKRIV